MNIFVCCDEITLQCTSLLSVVCRASDALTADPRLLLSHMTGRRLSKGRRIHCVRIESNPVSKRCVQSFWAETSVCPLSTWGSIFFFFFFFLCASIHPLIPYMCFSLRRSGCLFFGLHSLSIWVDTGQELLLSVLQWHTVLRLWNPVRISLQVLQPYLVRQPRLALFVRFLSLLSDGGSRSRTFCRDTDRIRPPESS